MKLKGSILAHSFIGLAVLSVVATDARAWLEMGSYSNAPGGKEIEAGDYDAAIASASGSFWKNNDEDALIAATNLCVAYTVKRDLEGAYAACGEALTLARRADNATAARFSGGAATARALTNRGVLRAIAGDTLGAAADFRAAERSSGDWAAPSRNLAYLESSPAHRLAMARALD